VDLGQFAAFPLLNDSEGTDRLRTYFGAHATVAAQANVGFLLEAATWRANADWGALPGFDEQALDEVNRKAVELIVDVRDEFADTGHPYRWPLRPAPLTT